MEGFTNLIIIIWFNMDTVYIQYNTINQRHPVEVYTYFNTNYRVLKFQMYSLSSSDSLTWKLDLWSVIMESKGPGNLASPEVRT